MSAGFDFDTSEADVTGHGGRDRPVPGTYLLVITDRRDVVLSGAPAFRFVFEVLAGLPKDKAAGDQAGKTFEQSFFLPNPLEADKDKVRRNASKLSRLGLATEAITVEQFCKPKDVNGKRIVQVDWDDTIGMPFFAHLKFGYKKPEFTEIPFAEDIFHVASAAVKDVPRDQDAIDLAGMRGTCPFAEIKAREEAARNEKAAEPLIPPPADDEPL